MILKLNERYRYDKENKDLRTHLIEFVSGEHFVIDLAKEVSELENNEQFMTVWSEECFEEYKKHKYCLSSRPDIPAMDMFDMNDYETAKWMTNGEIMPCKVIFIRADDEYLLLDKRRWDIEIFNNENILIEKLS